MLRSCDSCGVRYEAKRKASRFCGDTCRKRARRGAVVGLSAKAEASPAAASSVMAAVRVELEAAGRAGSSLGAQALALAGKIDAGGTDSGAASLSRELRATMAEALRDVAKSADRLDELSARREMKAAGA